MRHTTFVAALTAAVMSCGISVTVSHALNANSQVNNPIVNAQLPLPNPQSPSTQGQVANLANQVTALTATVNSLMPLLHSMAERLYATCYMVTAAASPIGWTTLERLPECYSGFFNISQFHPDDLYTSPAP